MMRKKRIYLIICSILILIFGFAIIYTEKAIYLYWHLTHPNPVLWEGIKIMVPKDMMGSFDDGKKFSIYSVKDPFENNISFRKKDFSKFDFDDEKKIAEKFHNAGYILLEKGNKKIGEYNAHFVRTRSTINPKIYNEDIYIEVRNIAISFTGLEANRKEFLDILSNISFQEE